MDNDDTRHSIKWKKLHEYFNTTLTHTHTHTNKRKKVIIIQKKQKIDTWLLPSHAGRWWSAKKTKQHITQLRKWIIKILNEWRIFFVRLGYNIQMAEDDIHFPAKKERIFFFVFYD